MSDPKTLLELSGADTAPVPLSQTALVLIDCQEEYRSGFLPLPGVDRAMEEVAEILDRARTLGVPLVHVRHVGKPGGAFDPGGPGGQIMAEVAPMDGEAVVDKGLPNAFAGTALHEVLTASARDTLTIVGFMTHMCVSSTARAALDLGYRTMVVDSACATRDLPRPGGGVVSAADLHVMELAALSDRFATIAPDSASVPD
ncbi:MAG: cysteine hydrolase family protein [Alphaproteobacteria bacterium]